MRSKKRRMMVILCCLLFAIVSGGLYHYRYRDIHETIRKGEAYGFRIGDDKETTFWRIANMPVPQGVFWITVDGGKEFRQLEDVADEFSDWKHWSIRDPKKKEFCLSFKDYRLSLLYEFLGYGERIIPLTSWPQEKNEAIPCVKPGMSYEEVYQTLLNLHVFEAYQEIQVQPRGYRQVTTFTEDEFDRIKKQDEWIVDLPPEALYMNYIFLRFKDETLTEIIRQKDAPDFLDDIIDIIFGTLSYLRE